jgi:hypothetical protein
MSDSKPVSYLYKSTWELMNELERMARCPNSSSLSDLGKFQDRLDAYLTDWRKRDLERILRDRPSAFTTSAGTPIAAEPPKDRGQEVAKGWGMVVATEVVENDAASVVFKEQRYGGRFDTWTVEYPTAPHLAQFIREAIAKSVNSVIVTVEKRAKAEGAARMRQRAYEIASAQQATGTADQIRLLSAVE